jgi:hypothetical protein
MGAQSCQALWGYVYLCFVALSCLTYSQGAELTTAQWNGTATLPADVVITVDATTQDRFAISLLKEKLAVEKLPSKALIETKAVVILNTAIPAAETAPILTDATATLPRCGGAAVWKSQLICCLTRESALLVIDLQTNKICRQALPDFLHPRAPAYDPAGTLWMFSGNSLTEIQFTSDGHFNPIHHEGDFDHPEALRITADGKFHITEPGNPARQIVLSHKRERISIDREVERK